MSAIRIRDGVVADQAELAGLVRVTKARVSQIMNLLNLAPNIQEEILCLKPPPWTSKETPRRCPSSSLANVERHGRQATGWPSGPEKEKGPAVLTETLPYVGLAFAATV